MKRKAANNERTTAQRDALADCLKKLEKSSWQSRLMWTVWRDTTLPHFSYQVIGKMDENWTRAAGSPRQPVKYDAALQRSFSSLMPNFPERVRNKTGTAQCRCESRYRAAHRKIKASSLCPTPARRPVRKAKAALPH